MLIDMGLKSSNSRLFILGNNLYCHFMLAKLIMEFSKNKSSYKFSNHIIKSFLFDFSVSRIMNITKQITGKILYEFVMLVHVVMLI